jgi:hypothetical protein
MGKGQKMDAFEQSARIVIEQRMIENPHTTDALVDAALERGEEEAGWIPAYVNLVTMIGGLARIKGLTEVQKAAAARYRSLQERAQIGTARATDYAAVRGRHFRRWARPGRGRRPGAARVCDRASPVGAVCGEPAGAGDLRGCLAA